MTNARKDESRNTAFIDGQNLHKGMSRLSWQLDYYRLRHYLRAKFNVKDAYSLKKLARGSVVHLEDIKTKIGKKIKRRPADR